MFLLPLLTHTLCVSTRKNKMTSHYHYICCCLSGRPSGVTEPYNDQNTSCEGLKSQRFLFKASHLFYRIDLPLYKPAGSSLEEYLLYIYMLTANFSYRWNMMLAKYSFQMC